MRKQQHARNLIIALLPLLASCATVQNAAVTEAGKTRDAAVSTAETKATDATSTAAGELPRAPGIVTPPALPSPALQAPAPAPAASAPQAHPGRIKYHHRYVNVRPEPSSDKKPVAVLAGGKRIEVLEENGKWVKIRWARGKKELEGWVFKKYVDGYE